MFLHWELPSCKLCFLVCCLVSLLMYLPTVMGFVCWYLRHYMNYRNFICILVNVSVLCVPVQQPRGEQNIPLTPPARISAMNIVGDLLRKVGVSVSANMYTSLQYWYMSLFQLSCTGCYCFLYYFDQFWTNCCSFPLFSPLLRGLEKKICSHLKR